MNKNSKYKDLYVNRKGNSVNSYMKTTDNVEEILPNQFYELIDNKILKTNNTSTNLSSKIITPDHCILKGEWTHPQKNQEDKSSILGDIGPFIAKNETLEIPVAATSHETLNYYGAKLLNSGDIFKFDTKVHLPLFSMDIGQDYVEDYMLQKEHANGIFIEFHDRPHFHMPMNEHATGYLILGKKIKENIYHLSAFAIPFKSAIYTPPYVIHNDSFLIGKYYVVYSKTDDFSTVRLLDSSKNILDTKIVGL